MYNGSPNLPHYWVHPLSVENSATLHYDYYLHKVLQIRLQIVSEARGSLILKITKTLNHL